MDKERQTPRIEDYATIEAYVGETPVYAFGYTYVYGLGPDLLPGVVLQEGNTSPVRKFLPKKSWEITSNYCGSTPAREPKTMWNDDQPLLPVHLIDGNPRTAWCSRGMIRSGTQSEWIRIDIPAECVVSAIELMCVPEGTFPVEKLGRALPKRLSVKVSRDGCDWQTVYEGAGSVSDGDTHRIAFEPTLAKTVWIIGEGFDRVGDLGAAFSLAQVCALDPEGRDHALISSGAGVQVSSTYYGFGMDRFTQDMLWPIQYDLGFKWTRVGYDIGLFLWSYVERDKGVFAVDPKADRAVTEACENGLHVILCLDKGNWLYHDPPRKADWRKTRTSELMETYEDHPGWPHESDVLMAGYLRYVDFMVRHFKGHVAYFEVGNEWVESIGVDNYLRILQATIPVIKKADPEARIMLGSVEITLSGINHDAILACLRSGSPPIATQVDAVGFHPWYHPDVDSDAYRGYREDFERFKCACEKLGFTGRYIASEWSFFASYPRPQGETVVQRLLHEHWGTEMQKAKYTAQLMTAHAGMGIVSLFNETFQTARLERDVTLLRNSSFQTDPITPSQPQAAYYVLRNLSTVLDGYEPAAVEVALDGESDLTCYTFRRGETDILVAVWIPGRTEDGIVQCKVDLTLPAVDAARARIFDVMNGTEQPMTIAVEAGRTLLKDVLVKDFPTCIELTDRNRGAVPL